MNFGKLNNQLDSMWKDIDFSAEQEFNIMNKKRAKNGSVANEVRDPLFGTPIGEMSGASIFRSFYMILKQRYEMVMIIGADECPNMICLGDDFSRLGEGKRDELYDNCIKGIIDEAFVCENQADALGELCLESVKKILDLEGGFKKTYKLKNDDGEIIYLSFVYSYFDENKMVILLTCEDVTKEHFWRKERREELKTAILNSQIDGLTGLYNKTTVIEKIDEVLRENINGAAMIAIDLDNFKKANDEKGHIFGDRVLMCFAKLLKQSFRKGDIVGRFGGDEFVVLMPDIDSEETVKKKISSIKMKMKTSECLKDTDVSFTSGYSFYKRDGKTFKELFEVADFSLYEQKRNGMR